MSEETEVVELPKSSSKIVPLLLGVNSVALVGVLAVVLLRGSGSQAKAAAPEGEAAAEGGEHREGGGPGPTLKLADFTSRLRGGEGERYARLSIEIEVATEKDKEELGARVPQLRDAFIRYMADLKVEDVSGSAAISKTKDELTQKLHEVTPSKAIKALYITDLVVQ